MIKVNNSLSTSRAGFIYRGSKLFNKLPEELRKQINPRKLRTGVRKWVSEKISARPV